MKQLTDPMLDNLSQLATQSPRLRANHNLHQELDDPIQRLAIAMEPDTLVRPHRHVRTWEMLLPLRGRFVVLCFDDAGTVTSRTLLGEGCAVIEMPAGTWHAVLSLDCGGVIFEVKHGPYDPQTASDFAPWCAADADAAQLNAWYAHAQIGDSFSL
ncbi:MAG: cupin fold metalloprotein, WbuC family [Sideroxydans sp.]|nr:cupin fold metalloprotein, WbuC family [Sideroxydans sp.]